MKTQTPISDRSAVFPCHDGTDVHNPAGTHVSIADSQALELAANAMEVALNVAHACGTATEQQLFDKEWVEGWWWSHPDGREWTLKGSWSDPAPMHPVVTEALATFAALKGAR